MVEHRQEKFFMGKKQKIIFYLGMLLTPLYFFLALEFSTRAITHFVATKYLRYLLLPYRALYFPDKPDTEAYLIGHPFSQCIGNYKNKAVSSKYHINSLGFTDDEFIMEKPKGVIRIAALGGSTTAGYEAWPNQLERLLNTGSKHQYEVMNFGIEGYNTAHSIVNLALHVMDFQPDIVSLHDCYNEPMARPAKL
jgi:hypothetical protein